MLIGSAFSRCCCFPGSSKRKCQEKQARVLQKPSENRHSQVQLDTRGVHIDTRHGTMGEPALPSSAEHVEMLRKIDKLQTDLDKSQSEKIHLLHAESTLKKKLEGINRRMSSFLGEHTPGAIQGHSDELDQIFDLYYKLEEQRTKLVIDLSQNEAEFLEQLEEKENRRIAENDSMRKYYEQELSAESQKFRELEKKLIIGADYSQPKEDSEFKGKFDELHEKIRCLTEDAKCAEHVNQKPWAENVENTFGKPIESRRLKVFLERSIWDILEDKVFSTPFSVFGKYGEELAKYWHNFFGEGT
jgi:hypothetical protein